MAFFSLKSNIAKGIIGACAVGAVSAGSISANFVDLTNIKSVCKNVNQDELNKRLTRYISTPSTSFVYEIFKEKITKEIEDFINKNGAKNLTNNDIYRIMEKYLQIGKFVAIKVEDEKGDKRLVYNPFDTGEEKCYCGKYKKLDAEKLQKFFNSKIRRGRILDLDIIVDNISSEKIRKGESFQKENVTNEDIEEWINNSFTENSVLHSEDLRDIEKMKKAVALGHYAGFDDGFTAGAIAGVVGTAVGIVIAGATIWALSKLNVDGMEEFRTILNNARGKISNIFSKAGNNVINIFKKLEINPVIYSTFFGK